MSSLPSELNHYSFSTHNARLQVPDANTPIIVASFKTSFAKTDIAALFWVHSTSLPSQSQALHLSNSRIIQLLDQITISKNVKRNHLPSRERYTLRIAINKRKAGIRTFPNDLHKAPAVGPKTPSNPGSDQWRKKSFPDAVYKSITKTTATATTITIIIITKITNTVEYIATIITTCKT
jgi:hypothetical protein